MKLNSYSRIVKEGERQSSEKTDSEYYDKMISRVLMDYNQCPDDWKATFLAGLDSHLLKEIKDRLGLK